MYRIVQSLNPWPSEPRALLSPSLICTQFRDEVLSSIMRQIRLKGTVLSCDKDGCQVANLRDSNKETNKCCD